MQRQVDSKAKFEDQLCTAQFQATPGVARSRALQGAA